MIRIVLVAAHPAVRRGLRMWLALQPDFTVIGEAYSGSTALDVVATARPDVVVLAAELPPNVGMTTAARLRALAPETAIVLLSLRDDMATRQRAQAAGVAAVLAMHEATGENLLTAIRGAAGAL